MNVAVTCCKLMAGNIFSRFFPVICRYHVYTYELASVIVVVRLFFFLTQLVNCSLKVFTCLVALLQ